VREDRSAWQQRLRSLELELEATRQEAAQLREKVGCLAAAAQQRLDGAESPLALPRAGSGASAGAAAALPAPGGALPARSGSETCYSGGGGAAAAGAAGRCAAGDTPALRGGRASQHTAPPHPTLCPLNAPPPSLRRGLPAVQQRQHPLPRAAALCHPRGLR
jgi:hypothetical protein